MVSSAFDGLEATNIVVVLSPGQRLALGCLCEALTLEMAHLGVVTSILSQIVGIEWLVLLLLEVVPLKLVVELLLSKLLLPGVLLQLLLTVGLLTTVVVGVVEVLISSLTA